MSHALIYYLEINIYQGIYKFTSLVHIIIIMVIDLCDGLMFLSLVCRSLGSLNVPTHSITRIVLRIATWVGALGFGDLGNRPATRQHRCEYSALSPLQSSNT